MTDQEWRSLILTKIEKIEESQSSITEMLYAHTLASVTQNSEVKQNHNSLKVKVNILWGAVIVICSTILTAFVSKKI